LTLVITNFYSIKCLIKFNHSILVNIFNFNSYSFQLYMVVIKLVLKPSVDETKMSQLLKTIVSIKQQLEEEQIHNQ